MEIATRTEDSKGEMDNSPETHHQRRCAVRTHEGIANQQHVRSDPFRQPRQTPGQAGTAGFFLPFEKKAKGRHRVRSPMMHRGQSGQKIGQLAFVVLRTPPP